jgi:DNA-binding NtrC family response regulator
MPDRIVSTVNNRQQLQYSAAVVKKCVLVFSPDTDLARFLLMNLEDKFQIIREHCLEQFEKAIKEISPDLVLIDLFAFSTDIVKQLDIVRRTAATIPIIALRAYMSLTPEINKSIDDLADIVFYKPVDGELITQAIEDLLKQRHQDDNMKI